MDEADRILNNLAKWWDNYACNKAVSQIANLIDINKNCIRFTRDQAQKGTVIHLKEEDIDRALIKFNELGYIARRAHYTDEWYIQY